MGDFAGIGHDQLLVALHGKFNQHRRYIALSPAFFIHILDARFLFASSDCVGGSAVSKFCITDLVEFTANSKVKSLIKHSHSQTSFPAKSSGGG